MPKWQTDDYYENNFRINKYDSVTPYFKANANLASSTAFTSGGEHYIAAGAVSVGLSAAVAFAAAALTFWKSNGADYDLKVITSRTTLK